MKFSNGRASSPSTGHKLPSTHITFTLLRIADKIFVKRKLRDRPAIAGHHQFFPCPGHGYIHPPYFGKKTNYLVGIAAGHADINNVTLLALETVNGINTDDIT